MCTWAPGLRRGLAERSNDWIYPHLDVAPSAWSPSPAATSTRTAWSGGPQPAARELLLAQSSTGLHHEDEHHVEYAKKRTRDPRRAFDYLYAPSPASAC